MSGDLSSEARSIYRLIQSRRHHDAIDRLVPFIDAADAAERSDLCARGLAWLGQSYLATHSISDARKALRKAAAVATAIGDQAGLEAIRELRHQWGAQAMATRSTTTTHDDSPIGRACAAFDAGDSAQGIVLAQEALQAAQSPRDEVLALLAMARAPSHAETSVLKAAQVADRSNDFNLITAVTRAARAAKVRLPPKVF